MSKVYTKGGDGGQTSLYGGTRVSKASAKVAAYGAVDSANAAIGLAANYQEEPIMRDLLRVCQEKLFVVGGELASDPVGLQKLKTVIVPADSRFIEGVIDEISGALTQNEKFVLPGSCKASAYLHSARTAVRTAERAIITHDEMTAVNPQLIRFINRLSDLLFVMSRYADLMQGSFKQESAVSQETPKIKITPGEEKPQSGSSKTVTLALAEKMALEGLKKAASLGVPVVISIVDEGGHLVTLKRMENAHVGSIDISMNKAFTAHAFKIETAALATLTEPGQPLYGIQETNGGRVVVFGGGIPILKDGKALGAIGVSGGTVEEDVIIAKSAMNIYEIER